MIILRDLQRQPFVGRKGEVMECPARRGSSVVGDVNEASWHIGLNGHLEAVQRTREAISNGFDVGLFSCPARKNARSRSAGASGRISAASSGQK